MNYDTCENEIETFFSGRNIVKTYEVTVTWVGEGYHAPLGNADVPPSDARFTGIKTTTRDTAKESLFTPSY